MSEFDREEPAGFRDGTFVRRVLIVMGLGALALLIWRLSDVLILVFAAVLVAAILRALADVIARWTPVPKRWSLAPAGLLILALVGGMLLLFGTQLRGQVGQIATALPAALNSAAQGLGLGAVSHELPNLLGTSPGGGLLARAATFGTAAIGALADFFLVIVAGVFLAADPKLYRSGFVKLFPIHLHERIEAALDAAGKALTLWLAGQLVSMTLVGVLTGLAFWAIGLPSPIALGFIAGLAEFIPLIGPIAGAVPAVLIAATLGSGPLLWTLVAVIVIQQIESNLITPVVARRVVSLPPVLALFAVVIFGVLFGIPGVLVAVPLAVVVFVLVKKLYVRDTLGEETPIPGEKGTGGT